MSGSVSYELFASKIGGSEVGFTTEGGLYQVFINDTGADSVKGTIVVASTQTEDAVEIAPADTQMPIGAIYEDGIADGSNVKVVTYGKVQVLMEDSSASTKGYWCGVSGTAGRMFQQSSAPVGTSIHNREIGKSLEDTVAGTDVLSWVQMHFN
jgi:hypothetical protein